MKRFTETTKWNDRWFRGLPAHLKCLWIYLCDNCDSAGVIEIDWELASFSIGQPVSVSDLGFFTDKVERFDQHKLLLPKFVPFQYKKLSEDCPAHLHVFERLKKHNLAYDYPSLRVGTTLKEKEEDKETDKEEEKERRPNGKFEKPTIDAMRLHGAKIGLPDAEVDRCFNYYESNGWRVGKNPMKSWPAAMVNWRGNWQERGGKNGKSSPVPAWAQVKAIEQQIEVHAANRDSIYYRDDCTAEQRADLKSKRAKLVELNSKIAEG